MLLINFFKEASENFSVSKNRNCLVLFLFPYSKKVFLSAFCTLFSSFCFSQNLDSLLTVAKQTNNDSIKLRMYNEIAFSFIFNDTKKAVSIIEEGKKLAEEAQFNFGLTELTNTHGIYMDVTGMSDSAKYYFEKALKMSRDFGFKNIESMCINNLGMFNWNRGNYQLALDYFFQSLKMDEEHGNEKSTASALNNIGLIYQEMNLSEKALEYHRKALSLRKKYNLVNDQISSLNNIGINLKDLRRIDEAIAIYKKGVDLANHKKNYIEYYRLLDNLANAYKEKGQVELALTTYIKALDKPQNYDADEKSMLSTYNNIASLYNESNKPNIALRYVDLGFNLVKKYPDIELIATDLYLTGSESYYMLNNFDKARVYKSNFIKLRDSIFSETNATAVADLEIKYETEKKEREILEQRAEIAENKLTIQKQNYQLYGLLALALVLGLLGYLIFNQQRLKNKQLAKEAELKDALLKIETQNKLQEQRLRISRDLHDNIGAQLAFIISSIDNLKYAFKIEDYKLQDKLSDISNFASDTIYELRDTIWAMNKSVISFEDLQTRISNYIDKAHLYDANIKFSYTVDDSVNEDRTFTSVHGMNIYRIIQEAMHNSLKYSKASKISIEVTKKVSNLIFKIKDNGIGFDINHVERGNGLNNMEKRALDIGAAIEIDSKPNKGTSIKLIV